MSLAIEDGQKISGIFTRTVTNVGSPDSTYHAKIDKPDSLNITVEPSVLSFSAVRDKKTFIVNVKGKHITQVPIVSGSISWIDGVHMVRTLLVVYTVLPSAFADNPSHQITHSATKKNFCEFQCGLGGD